MTDVGQDHGPSPRHPAGERLGVADIDDAVVPTPDHQGRDLHGGQFGLEVVIVRGTSQFTEDVFLDRLVGDRTLGEDVRDRPRQEGHLLHGEFDQCLEFLGVAGNQRIVALSQGLAERTFHIVNTGGTEQHQSFHFLRMTGGIQRGDGAAHRIAEQDGARHGQVVEHRGDVGHLIVEVVAAVEGFAALAVSWKVDEDEMVIVLEMAGHAHPVVLVGAEAVDHDQGALFARRVVLEGDDGEAVCLDAFFAQIRSCPLPGHRPVVELFLEVATAGEQEQEEGDQQALGMLNERVCWHEGIRVVFIWMGSARNSTKSPVRGQCRRSQVGHANVGHAKPLLPARSGRVAFTAPFRCLRPGAAAWDAGHRAVPSVPSVRWV